MISLIDVSLSGIVYLVFWSIQNLLSPLNTILELLIDLHSSAMFFRIRMLFCLFIFMLINVGFTLVVLYPVITKDTCIVLLLLFLHCVYCMFLDVLNKINVSNVC